MKNLQMIFFTTFAIDNNTALLFMGIFIVVALVMIVFMIRGVKRDRKKIMQSLATKDTMSPQIFEQLIARAYEKAGKKTKFTLYFLRLIDVPDIVSAFGKDVYDDAVDKLITRLENTFPWSVKTCKYAQDTIAIFTGEPMTVKEIKDHAEYMAYEAKKVHVMAANLRFAMNFNIGVNEKNEFSKTPEEFWQNVTIALESAAKVGANTYAVYSAELTNRETEEYKFYQEIKRAIEEKEFELYYQPIVDIKTREPVAYESLLRWNHKTLGLLSPSKYLNIIEQSGDIIWVGIWAFEELVKQYVAMREKNPTKKIILAMNLSYKQLMSDTLINDFRRIAKKYHVTTDSFCFEINEIVNIERSDAFKNTVMKYRQAGFLIAVDSYGLESNSIALLEKIDIDVIKLDQDFLNRAENNFLLGNLMTMLYKYAEKKNAMLIEERIENEEQVKLAEKFGIPYGQGFYFGEPTAASKL